MIIFQNLVKDYVQKGESFRAVDQVSFQIEKGEIFGIVGLSGAGKSTLLRCINGLEVPSQGEVIVAGQMVSQLNGKPLLAFRQEIGMIFQHFNLLSSRTVYGNIAFPLENLGWSKEAIHTRVLELLNWIDLKEKADMFPTQLSGGQKQRVAIARALAGNPKLLLCDEATSALDPVTTRNILKLLKRINEEFGITIVLITHETEVVNQICDRVAVMSKGKLTHLGSPIEVFKTDSNTLYQAV